MDLRRDSTLARSARKVSCPLVSGRSVVGEGTRSVPFFSVFIEIDYTNSQGNSGSDGRRYNFQGPRVATNTKITETPTVSNPDSPTAQDVPTVARSKVPCMPAFEAAAGITAGQTLPDRS